jgi:flavin-dependent dehydrogenase
LVELEHLGITSHEKYARTNIIRHAAVYLDGKRLIRRPFPTSTGFPPYGRVIPRLQLDSWLIDAARQSGVTVIEGTRAVGFDTDQHSVVARAMQGRSPLEFRARILIGADGSSSTVARCLRGGGPPDSDRIVAVRGYYEGISGYEDQAALYFSAETFPGYYWLFPTGSHSANVGVGMLRETLPETTEHLPDLLLGLIKSDPALADRLGEAHLIGKIRGWPLTTYDSRLPLVCNRVVLIGDAAGFINPLNGEGIQYALLSARWAAKAVSACLATGDCSEPALQAYADEAELELRYDMALAGLVVQAIRNRHLTPVWLRILRMITARACQDGEYAEVMGGILAGLTPARDALRSRTIISTADQVAHSLVSDLLVAAFHGPSRLLADSVGLSRHVVSTADSLVRHPRAFMEWLVGMARQSGELAGRFLSRPVELGSDNQAMNVANLKLPLDHVVDDLLDESLIL